MKRLSIMGSLLMIAMILFIFTACQSSVASNATQGSRADITAESSAVQTSGGSVAAGEQTFTAEELKKYDGKNGNKAYVAVDGKVYDVTDVPQWKNGDHNGYTAGQDLTDIIKNKSPHGMSALKDVPVVGTYTGK